jgi:hypothetical protein
MIDNFQQPLKMQKFKRYQLFTLFSKLSEIIFKRIKTFISGKLEDINQDSDILKLYYFLKGVDDRCKVVEIWASIKSQKKERTKIKYFFADQDNFSVKLG